MPANTARTDRGAESLTGTEPPLTLTENSRAALKSGGVSLRWLAGAFVTGISGAALIGGALVTSVEGALQLADPMESWSIVRLPDAALGLGDRNSSTAKGDKIDVGRKTETVRKVIQTTAVRRVGEKEFISIRPYELVTIPIATSAGEFARDLPAFNPLKIFADGGVFSDREEEPPTTPEIDSDAVSVELVAFSDAAEAGDVVLDGSAELAAEEIAAAVRAAVPFDENTEIAFTLPAVPEAMTGGVGFSGLRAFADPAGFGERAASLPPKETVLAKTPADPLLEEADSTRIMTVAPGDTLSSLLAAAGVGSMTAQTIAETMRPVFAPSDLQPGQQLHVALKSGADAEPEFIRMSLFDDGAHLASVRRSETEAFVALDASAEIVRPVIAAAPAAAAAGQRASIYAGLYEAGKRNEIPDTVLNRLVQVHSYDVDFQKKVQPGDSFTAFFELADGSGAPPDALPLYISMTVRGEGRGFYKFRTPDDGVIDYYDSEGRSAKKFLIRKPMNGGVFRSGFGQRRHPILRYRRMHNGVDWAAPRGTPIVAAGNATVVKAGWQSGFGNHIRLRHANGYETTYSHMSKIATGVSAGGRVRQGQEIGYVGSTGLSTGPHLHYEVEVNGRYVDPLRIRLPRGRVLQADMLETFEKERARIDDLMARPPVRSTVAGGGGAVETRKVAAR